MEVGLEPGMPTYSGGLGVLAGDAIRSAADMQIPMAAVTLLYRKGYFRQKLDPEGQQTEVPEDWKIEHYLKEIPKQIAVTIEGRKVLVRAWQYDMVGTTGFEIPVYFLDTDLEKNSEWDRTLSHFLYGGEARYRVAQEIILGIGGVKMLRALGHRAIERFHMNEGHSSFLTLELLEEQLAKDARHAVREGDVERVRERCVFTTHTPVPAGHDQFSKDLVEKMLGPRQVLKLKDLFDHDVLNMTHLALHLSGYVNGVAKKHGEISRQMFADENIDSITNGIHAATWAAKPLQELFDRHIPGWRQDNSSLRHALKIPKLELWEAHMDAKQHLLDQVEKRMGVRMDVNLFTVGFARRATAYKRADLIFQDLERLKRIVAKSGRFQILYGGKAHPHDEAGKELIRRIHQAKGTLKNDIPIVYLENYDMELAKFITSGVDLWLNNPEPPLEASGTSGMKAAVNGIPSLSILDGWWIEGHIEGVTGWFIDEKNPAASLYLKLAENIIPLFYQSRDRFLDVMANAIALNGSYFNTQRMLGQYVVKAYFV